MLFTYLKSLNGSLWPSVPIAGSFSWPSRTFVPGPFPGSLASASPPPPQALSRRILVGPQVCWALKYRLAWVPVPPFAYRAVGCLSFKALLKHHILPGVARDSPGWTFGVTHCIMIVSLYLLGVSMRMGTVTPFSPSCVLNTGRRAWCRGALQRDADGMSVISFGPGWHFSFCFPTF